MPQFPVKKRLYEPLQRLSIPPKESSAFSALSVLVHVFLFPREDSSEKGINDKEALDKLYQEYMDNDSMNLLNDEFYYLIDELSENGQIKESVAIEEDNDLVNFVGNVVGEVETIERENKMEQPLK